MIPNFDLEFDGQEYEVLAYVDEGRGYDWSVTAILQRKSDKSLFIATDAGCSCDFFGMLNPIDRQVYSLDEAVSSLPVRVRGDMARSLATMKGVYV